MFTQCPECQTIHPLTIEQLRSSRGMMRCSHCAAMFDSLAFISETAAAEPAEKPQVKPLPWDKKKPPAGAVWRVGLGLGVLLLIAQIAYFEGYALSQNPHLRPWLEKACSQLKCRLPDYKKLDELAVLQRSFGVLPDRNYAFRVVLGNQAAFSQQYPDIELTLLNFNGQAFASRIFRPSDYLPETAANNAIGAEAAAEISLIIAAPKTRIGGYNFDLSYQ